MIKKIIKEIKKEEKSRVDTYGEYMSSTRRLISLDEFQEDIIKYFKLDEILKDQDDDDFSYPNEHNYLRQKHPNLNYIIELLDWIKPYIMLSIKLSYLGLDKEIKRANLSEDSIVNILDNFVRLRRTGRSRVFYKWEKKEFLEFKEKYSNIIEFHKEIKSWERNDKKGSMVDYGRAIKKYNLLKEGVNRYLLEINHWTRDCGRSTKYRFDKDIFLIEDSKYNIEYILKDYDFLLKCLKDHEEYQELVKQDQLI